MNNTYTQRNTIALSELNANLTPDEQEYINTEKKYYDLVVALRTKRRKKGYTQEKLAQLSHLPRTTITKVESGSRNTTLETLMTMARALGSTVELRLT